MTVTEAIADYTVGFGAAGIPDAAMRAATEALTDFVACAVAGVDTEVGRIASGMATTGGTGPASILGTDRSASVHLAALANGTTGHALDYDDICWSFCGHPSVAIIPAALAVAEARASSGRALLEAIVLGFQVAGKIGEFCIPGHYSAGWHATSAIGVFGAAAAACHLSRANTRQTRDALGIAASQSGGLRRNFGSMTKPFHAGRAAMSGVMAAELGLAGLSADAAALEGRYGWFSLFSANQTPDAAEMANALNRGLSILEPGIVYKRYPACGATHCALDGLLDLIGQAGIQPDDVELIDCQAHPLAREALIHARPATGLEAKFSMEGALALACVFGHPGIREFSDAGIQDSRVQALVSRIAFSTDERLMPEGALDGIPARVVLRTRDGREMSAERFIPIGDPRLPMSQDDRRRKFDDCCGQRYRAPQRDCLWEMLEGISSAPSVCGAISGGRLEHARTNKDSAQPAF